MSHSEAWTITAVGLGAVWVGLLLCYASVQLVRRFAARLSWIEGEHAASARVMAADGAAAAVTGEPVPADILAVIATAIEVERKLYVSRPDVRRPATQF